MTKIVVLILILVSLTGCAAVNSMYDSPNPGAISLGPREEMRLHFGDPERGFGYANDDGSILIERRYDDEGVAGRERAVWLNWIWKF